MDNKMNHTTWGSIGYKLRPKLLFSFLVCLLLITGCIKPTKTDEALKRVRERAPIGNHQELQSRLRLPAERLGVITIGETGKTKVSLFLLDNSGGTGYECKAAGCACFGDEDCNRMFTQVCADPATDGSCSGEPPVCTCHP